MSDAGYPDRWGRQCDRCGVVITKRTAAGHPVKPLIADLRHGWLTNIDGTDTCPLCLPADPTDE